MNLLVVGNGFDLEHGLPTQYKDFLDFIYGFKILINGSYRKNGLKEFERIVINGENTYIDEVNNRKKEPRNFNEYVKNMLLYEDAFTIKGFEEWSNQDHVKNLKNYCDDNIWIEYFVDKRDKEKKTWIDFESEISEVIQSLDYMRKYRIKAKENKSTYCNEKCFNIEGKVYKLLNRGINHRDINLLDYEEYKKIVIDRLKNDLNKLICALEIYLYVYVNNVDIKTIAPDIKNVEIDKVLSFNYTDTYNKIYLKNNINFMKYHYIHGHANLKEEKNNMIIGIDEYLDDDLINKETDFIAFKKYFQRIYKKTGSEYKSWLNNMNKSDEHNNIYFFGHSLDVTDKDVIEELIIGSNKKTDITIFYYNEETYESQIANLVKVIGKDELIKRVSRSENSITFKKQKSSVSLELIYNIEKTSKELAKELHNEEVYFNYSKNILNLGSDLYIYFEIINNELINANLYIDKIDVHDVYGEYIRNINDICTLAIKIKDDKYYIDTISYKLNNSVDKGNIDGSLADILKYIYEDYTSKTWKYR
ncbi:AbiH family protein [Clostridium sp. BL-8]|uniref:AbiH family protein n=1 Tax=Clostridium sp. BL-8 TaxID=349938 RepID=UPI00098CB2B3|nr:AbiH family protein [Clostridium sp. BL-8]OOM81221.1 hypothetical protein CLOBL_03290 [Clostridium sp. BL-8]